MESHNIMMESLPALLESLKIASISDMQNSLTFDYDLIRVFVKHHKDGKLISRLSKDITDLRTKARQNPNLFGINSSQLEWLSKLDNLFQSAVRDRINHNKFYGS